MRFKRECPCVSRSVNAEPRLRRPSAEAGMVNKQCALVNNSYVLYKRYLSMDEDVSLSLEYWTI